MFKPHISLPTLPLGKRGFLHGRWHITWDLRWSSRICRVSARSSTGNRHICCLLASKSTDPEKFQWAHSKTMPCYLRGEGISMLWDLVIISKVTSPYFTVVKPVKPLFRVCWIWNKIPWFSIISPDWHCNTQFLLGHTSDHRFHKICYHRFTSYHLILYIYILCSLNSCCCGAWHMSTCPSMHDAAAYFLPLGVESLCHFGALWLWVGQSEDKNISHPSLNVTAQQSHMSKCGSRPYRWRYRCSERQAWSNLIDDKNSKWAFNCRTSLRMWLIKGVAWWRPWSSK